MVKCDACNKISENHKGWYTSFDVDEERYGLKKKMWCPKCGIKEERKRWEVHNIRPYDRFKEAIANAEGQQGARL